MDLQKIFRRIISSGAYLPEIDGFRFIAIIWVVLFHSLYPILGNSHYKLIDGIKDYYLIDRFFANGYQGVELFFVISGFILAMPFARHHLQNEKKVRLRSYFLRRLTRLEPPYIIAMTFFFVVLIIKGDFKFWELLPSLGSSLIYMHNIIYQTYPLITMVAWSLEIEVQFYILAPLLTLVFLLPQTYRRIILIFLIAAFPTLQWFFPLKIMTIYSFIEFFLAGLLLADFYLTLKQTKINSMFLSGGGLILLLMIFYINHESTLINGIIYPFLVLLFYYVSIRDRFWNKFFNIKIITLIGGMCYSIYLLHFPFIALISKFSHFYKISDYLLPNLIINTVVVVILTVAISSVFYLLIERPCMDKNWHRKLYDKLVGNKP